jgi:hypothetical protein
MPPAMALAGAYHFDMLAEMRRRIVAGPPRF